MERMNAWGDKINKKNALKGEGKTKKVTSNPLKATKQSEEITINMPLNGNEFKYGHQRGMSEYLTCSPNKGGQKTSTLAMFRTLLFGRGGLRFLSADISTGEMAKKGKNAAKGVENVLAAFFF